MFVIDNAKTFERALITRTEGFPIANNVLSDNQRDFTTCITRINPIYKLSSNEMDSRY